MPGAGSPGGKRLGPTGGCPLRRVAASGVSLFQTPTNRHGGHGGDTEVTELKPKRVIRILGDPDDLREIPASTRQALILRALRFWASRALHFGSNFMPGGVAFMPDFPLREIVSRNRDQFDRDNLPNPSREPLVAGNDQPPRPDIRTKAGVSS